MIHRLTCFLLLFLFTEASSTYAQLTFSDKGKLSDVVFDSLNEAHFVQYLRDIPTNDSSFIARYFVFYKREGKHNGGMGFEIVKKSSNTPIWMTKPYGDYPPHSITILDFNKDNISDIMYLIGAEDVYSTKILIGKKNLDNTAKDYSANNFELKYENQNDYLIILDLEQDGIPEFIDSGYKGRVNKSNLLCTKPRDPFDDRGPSLTLNESLISDIKDEYLKLTNGFDDLNFNYNLPDRYQIHNMHLLSPVKILAFEGEKIKNVSSSYKEHLQWRIDILQRAKKISPQECYSKIDKTITYLSRFLD